ncbi:4-hydroxy-tetrahydrodipicolinate reductase [Candidatus Cyrtobacter comes]|uniref:4-hydroxy-tetrahydrodipicolinate reductase n=1 Tax=Candidatus Cyrtobacter comes TaxID=675776 RepID=A0ABU5L9C7_9RICK|nr:4-hydroxy-tetrahydrodipicolinate reductase [Candidatus Cyrtobacter comes]MDZ5762732.1 4-hydroxy-tetrahydrodipicolinate reductase [Candidatus Cyrtobacter comes]
MIQVTITGASGKMGTTILKLLDSQNYKYRNLIKAKALLSSKKESELYISDIHEGVKQSDITIDFTSASYALKIIKASALYNKKIIIGTTGFSDADLKEIEQYAQKIPIFLSPNMSIGIYILSILAQTATKALTNGSFDLNILEYHHRKKLDSPSGTAISIAKMLSNITGDSIKYNEQRRYDNEIHINSIRAGSIIGKHEITMNGAFEKISLIHEAFDRSIYATGALDAALFMSTIDKPGIYGMADLLPCLA